MAPPQMGETQMTKITRQDAIWTGVSDDERIVYRDVDDGPSIDGRAAWRGLYLKAPGTYTIQEGSADASDPVDPADWHAACAVMREVDAVADAAGEAQRAAANARLDAMADAIPDRMVDFFRADSDL